MLKCEANVLKPLLMGMLLASLAMPAAAFDINAGVTKESGPFDLFKFGFKAYKNGNKGEAVEAYRDGNFACIYLAPYNYHRIHMPLAGRVRRTVYVPGDLFSVNAATARTVPRLFARNERVICDFDTALGRMAVILVGALFVGSMETVHCGEINPPPRPRKAPVVIDRGNGRDFARGEELGRFNMGSTVVLLFQRDRIQWEAGFVPELRVQMGRGIGRTR